MIAHYHLGQKSCNEHYSIPTEMREILMVEKYFCKELTNKHCLKACPHFQHQALSVSRSKHLTYPAQKKTSWKFSTWSKSSQINGKYTALDGLKDQSTKLSLYWSRGYSKPKIVTHTNWRLRTVTFFKNSTLPAQSRLQIFQRISFEAAHFVNTQGHIFS